jgi:uncharacterized protein with NAD-binding domain and iron-sulfur cluster
MRDGAIPTVAIFGGGVAGMSAAHELAERGFHLRVYEKTAVAGGKARSLPFPNSGTDGRPDLPAEHGFRFFPSFYRHIPDTMRRIPVAGGGTVYDNLVETCELGLTRYGKPMFLTPDRLPVDPGQLWKLAEQLEWQLPQDLQIGTNEEWDFGQLMWRVLTSCDERRQDELEGISWWDYLQASSHSAGYREFFVIGLSTSLAASRARRANAKVEGDIVVQLLLDLGDPGISSDRLLNGPTSEVWILPWLKYLRWRGVRYHFDRELRELHVERGQIRAATVVNTVTGEPEQVQADFYILALPLEVVGALLRDHSSTGLLHADPGLQNVVPLAAEVDWMTGFQYYLTREISLPRGHALHVETPWALTSIFQSQFWPSIDLSQRGDGTVREILSAIISDWHHARIPGAEHPDDPPRAANKYAIGELKRVLWDQLKKCLVDPNGAPLLRDEDLRASYLHPGVNPKATEDDYYEEAEPLFVATTNTWQLRPDTYTRIPNLFLASDWVRTATQIACMESANEAARRAVNGILDARQSDLPRCRVWPLHEPSLLVPWRWYDRLRYWRGLPWNPRIPWFIDIPQRLLLRGHSVRRHVARAVRRRRRPRRRVR